MGKIDDYELDPEVGAIITALDLNISYYKL